MRKEEGETEKPREREKDIKDDEDNIFFLFICLFIVDELFICILDTTMENSIEKIEQQTLNSSDPISNSPTRNNRSSITQDDSSLASRQGL